MTIRELIDQLEDLAEEHGDDVEVRLAHQPSWPFEYSIDDVVAVCADDDDEAEAEDYPGQRVDGSSTLPVVYIAEKSQLGYLPGIAADALGWRK
jgi:hypothetical protein